MSMFSIHSCCQRSRLADLTLVIVGPSARCAPEQLEHRKTPKSREAPSQSDAYKSARQRYSLRSIDQWPISAGVQVFFSEPESSLCCELYYQIISNPPRQQSNLITSQSIPTTFLSLFGEVNPEGYILIFQVQVSQSQSKMANIQIFQKVDKFCRENVEMRRGTYSNGEAIFIKMISIKKIDELGISENLEFNKCAMGDLDSMIFPQHLLRWEEQINSSTIVGFITKPYEYSLFDFVKSKKIQEKEAMKIFDQIIKAIYSLYQEEFLTRQVRSEHIVFSEGKWRLATLIFNHENRSSEFESEYLWSNKHEAPECTNKTVFNEDQLQPMIVWNLGCILLEILLQSHKFSTKEAKNKIKDKPFTFKGFGLNERVWKDYSPQVEEVLQRMLMYDPKKRMSLSVLFGHQFLSPEVAKHFKINKPINKSQKIVIGKSSVRMGKLNESNRLAMKAVQLDMQEKQKNMKKTLRQSNILDVVNNDDFEDGLNNVLGQKSIKPIKPPSRLQEKERPMQQITEESHNPYTPVEPMHNPYTPVDPKREPENIQQIMNWQNRNIRQALYLYKSYYDQSELLNKSIDVIQQVKFPQMKPKEVEELQQLIEYSVTLVSLINLNALAEGFNQNRNVLDLDGDLFTAFSDSPQCSAFKKFVNFRKQQLAQTLEQVKGRLKQLKERPLMQKNPFISNMLKANYKVANFKDIKTAYRFIVKHAYDRISEQYNLNKHTEKANSLARIAMYVTYCLTTDKLYIKEDISDNFKFFFEWTKKPETNLVPLNEFKKYIDNAPKQILIKNSRYILKKYYDT